ncbi:MAG: glycosyltransferase family 39 protein [Planctomycetaceae bacterium]|nr:glycosyltransferase family 39 protein [Planctomycetaceae bacterium]
MIIFGSRRKHTQDGTAAYILTALLVIQTTLLGWSAFSNSAVVDEIAHLPAGISHWKFGRFDLYRVNPPLVRSMAAIPVLFTDCEQDWTLYQSAPLAREEFSVGKAFVKANGFRYFHYVSIARLACIPFSWVGMLCCYRWGRDLSGCRAGLLAAALWAVSPTMLAHGALITPDLGAAALGVTSAHHFWKWLRAPTWPAAITAGLTLGLAQLTKTSWVILFLVWPGVFVVSSLFRVAGARGSRCCPRTEGSGMKDCVQLATTLSIGIFILNAGYLFEGSFKPLGTYQFTCSTLTGHEIDDAEQRHKNRFVGTILHWLPVPLPTSYVEGLDLQKRDCETGQPAYLRGQWRNEGWWYYYLYGLAVKVPLGTLLMAVLSSISTGRLYWRQKRIEAHLLALMAPPLCLLVLVSMQTGLNKHFRYVLPVLPFLYISVAAVAAKTAPNTRALFCVLLLWSTISSLRVCPKSLVYFNELAGGPENGAFHLLDSNLDWGQSLIALREWDDSRIDNLPLYVSYSGLFELPDVGFQCQTISGLSCDPRPGWYAISVNRLYGTRGFPEFSRRRTPERILAHSMALFLVEE